MFAERWFFFGSLLDPDVLALVIGRRLDPENLQRASLHGYERVRVLDEHYPALRVRPECQVEGAVVSGLSAEDLRRICFFEDDEFELQNCSVRVCGNRMVRARFFQATARAELTDQPWNLQAWQRDRKAQFLELVKVWMAGYGRHKPAELEQQWQIALAAQDGSDR